jgi:hypothetical protein
VGPSPASASTESGTHSPEPRDQAGTRGWRLTRPARSGQIEGYTDPVSGLPGGRVQLKVSTAAAHYRVRAYRIGGYRGGDGRLVWRSPRLAGHRQPPPTLLPGTRTVVARWKTSVDVNTRGWTAGFYLFRLQTANGFQAYIPYTVHSATARGRVALVAPVMTWAAYDSWGGYDLYEAPPGHDRSWAVSLDRPNIPPGAGQFLYNVVPPVVLAERLGLPLAYETDIDVSERPGLLQGARGYVSLGHDEYWTVPERDAVTAARNAGTNLAFLSSNDVYWRVRLRRGYGGPDRTMVGYKTEAAYADPFRRTHPAATTARWRDPPHPDPENSLTGMLYECFPVRAAYRVVAPHWWGFRGTGVQRGTEFPDLVAQEADRVYPSRSTPTTLQILSYVRYSCMGAPTSSESVYYTTPSGAGVVDVGTQMWACALKPRCTGLPARDDGFARRVTANVLRAFANGPVGLAFPAHGNVSKFWLPPINQVPAS